MGFPKKVFLRDEGPREGFQILSQVIPTAKKLELIHKLATTGIKSIEVTSFVRPDRVPQHADAADVAAGLDTSLGVRYRALYLNEKGFHRALSCPALNIEGYLMIAVSDAFLRKNNNISLDDAIAKVPDWLRLFKEHKIPDTRFMVSTAFGDHFGGKIEAATVLDACDRVFAHADELGAKFDEITFADTTGYGNPEMVKRLVDGFRNRRPEVPVGLHLHDTRGTGMANVYAGLEEGVELYDCSVAGLGGCPFSKNAAGNVPTEDVAFLCQELGIETGVNLEAYIECAQLADEIVGQQLPGKLKQGGLLVQAA